MYVKDEVSSSIVVDKSEFICYMKRVNSEEEFKEYISTIKKKNHDARHAASALICGNIKRSNDDGEPSGTAGRPLLNVLEKNNLDQTCAVVIRYYGGVKLGTGGLTRAYSDSAIQTFSKATLAEDVIYPTYKLEVTYELANKIDYFIQNKTLLISKDYEEKVIFTFGVENNNVLEALKELTKGIEPVYLKDEIRQKII